MMFCDLLRNRLGQIEVYKKLVDEKYANVIATIFCCLPVFNQNVCARVGARTSDQSAFKKEV
jgi:hypothetical protein